MTDQIKILHRTEEQQRDIPFNDDATKSLATVAKNLEGMFINLESMPFVVGLNSSWGTGKTWFLTEWRSQLHKNGWSVISFNAWENDFLSEPILCLLSELSDVFSSDHKKSTSVDGMKKAAGFLLKRVAPTALRIATMGLIDAPEAIEAIAGEAIEDAASKALEAQSNLKEKLAKFKSSLTDLASEVKDETGKPLVILIDELDRCRPTFALEMLEAIKHLFDVRNVVFVLAFDGEQLACATQAVYGNQFNGTGYLRRFFNLQVGIPTDTDGRFIADEWFRMGFDGWTESRGNSSRFADLAEIRDVLKILTKRHSISFRGQQRILTRLSTLRLFIPDDSLLHAFPFSNLIVLEIVNRELFQSFLNGEADAMKVIDCIWSKSPFESYREDDSSNECRLAIVSAYYLLSIEARKVVSEGLPAPLSEFVKLYPKLESDFCDLHRRHFSGPRSRTKEWVCSILSMSVAQTPSK